MLWMSYIPTILTIIHLTAHRHRKSWLPPVMGVYQWFSCLYPMLPFHVPLESALTSLWLL